MIGWLLTDKAGQLPWSFNNQVVSYLIGDLAVGDSIIPTHRFQILQGNGHGFSSSGHREEFGVDSGNADLSLEYQQIALKSGVHADQKISLRLTGMSNPSRNY